MEVHKQVLTAGYKHCQRSGRDPTTSAYKGFKQTKKALVNMPNEWITVMIPGVYFLVQFL